MAEGVWKGVYLQVFGRSRQLSLNKFFDPSTPSMRKGRDGENRMENGKNNVENSGPLTTLPVDRTNANRLERHMLVRHGKRSNLSADAFCQK